MTALSRFWLVLVSIFSSLVLWVVVRLEQEPTTRRFENVPVSIKNLPRNLVALRPEEVTTTLIVKGPEDELKKISPFSLQPYVDATNLNTGAKQVRPVFLDRARIDQRYGIVWTLSNVPVTIEKVRVKRLNVDVDVVDSLTYKDLIYDNSAVDPEKVSVSGPSSQVNRVRRARVNLNLASVKENQIYSLDVELLDSNGNVVSDVYADPSRVNASPVLVPAPQSKSVFVQVNFAGSQPDFGYEVTRVEVIPSSVMINGSSAALAKTTTLYTEPINLKGLSDSAIIPVRLRIPPGIHMQKPTNVQVKVSVRQAIRPKASASPPAEAPPNAP